MSLQSVRLFATLWTVALQAPLSMGFSRQEYWSGLPCASPGNFPDPGIKLTSLTSPDLTGRFFSTSTTWEAQSAAYPRGIVIEPEEKQTFLQILNLKLDTFVYELLGVG